MGLIGHLSNCSVVFVMYIQFKKKTKVVTVHRRLKPLYLHVIVVHL